MTAIQITNLFKRLQAIYDRQWVTKYPDLRSWEQARNEWGKTLGKFSEEEIEAVLNRCQIDNSIRCPSLPDFYSLCQIEKNRLRFEKKFPAEEKGHYERPSQKTMDHWHEILADLENKHSPMLKTFYTLYETMMEKGVWVKD